MKPSLFLLLVFGSCQSLLAQSNTLKDENARYERDRKFNALHHIKQVNQYLVKTEKDAPNDSTLFCRVNYDKKGNVTQVIRYSPNAAAVNTEHNTDTDTYTYDKHAFLIKQTLNIGNYVITKKGPTKIPNDPYNNQLTTYEYDKDGRLIKEVYTTQIHSAALYHVGNTETYSYDAYGSLLQTKYYNAKGKPSSVTSYVYDDKHRLIRSGWVREGDQKEFSHEEYTYNNTDSGLVKSQKSYNTNGVLMYSAEYHYDAKGNYVKGYNIGNGKKITIWDFKYNAQNQVVESIGGPAKDRFIVIYDLRRDGNRNAHLFYNYTTDGLLTTIKKYESNIVDHKEHLAAVEKLVYIKY